MEKTAGLDYHVSSREGCRICTCLAEDQVCSEGRWSCTGVQTFSLRNALSKPHKARVHLFLNMWRHHLALYLSKYSICHLWSSPQQTVYRVRRAHGKKHPHLLCLRLNLVSKASPCKNVFKACVTDKPVVPMAMCVTWWWWSPIVFCQLV